MVRVAINGFGRIGRNAFKIAFAHPELKIVAINDLTNTKTLSYLLAHDTNYGHYDQSVGYDEKNIIVAGEPIPVLAEKDPAHLPWREMQVDIVIECTGRFTHHEDLQLHVKAGARKVVLSAPEKDDKTHDTFVIGANETELKPEHTILSNASCTTNCIAPVMAVLAREPGIVKSLMTTVHSYTASQVLQDGPAKDLRESRAAAENSVPTTTGAAIAATLTVPTLKGLFDGMSIRVPTPVVSIADITFVSKRKTAIEEINGIMKKVSQSSHRGIIDYTEEELVSSDYVGNPHSAIVDAKLTNVVDGDLVKVVAWYDNEWGYSNRLVELVALAGRSNK